MHSKSIHWSKWAIVNYYFYKTNRRNFLRSPLTPIKNIFKGERASKKKRFFDQNFSKELAPHEENLDPRLV